MVNFILRYPFLRPLIGLLLGIWLGITFKIPQPYIFLSLLLIAVVLSYFYLQRYNHQWIFGTALLLFLFVYGNLIAPRYTSPNLPERPNQKCFGLVERVVYGGDDKWRLTVFLFECYDAYEWNGKRLEATIHSNTEIANLTGQEICFKSDLSPIVLSEQTNGFNYNLYLLRKDISGRIKLIDYQIITQNKHYINPIISFCYFLNKSLMQSLKNAGLQNNELGVMLALINGDRSLISPSIKKDYQQTGTTHILAVSGLHVGVIMQLLLFAFGWLNPKQTGWLKAILIIALLWFYALLANLEPSIIRATLMFSFIILAKELKRGVKSENSLFLSAFIILVVSPQAIFDAGFWLSYIAVGSILLFAKPLEQIVKIENLLFKKIWQLISVCFAAQIAVTPLLLYLFGTLSTYFLLSNLLILPVVSIAMFGGLSLALISTFTSMAVWVAWPINKVVWYMNECAKTIATLPYATITIGQIKFTTMFFLYTIGTMLYIYLKTREFKYLIGAKITLLLLFIVEMMTI